MYIKTNLFLESYYLKFFNKLSYSNTVFNFYFVLLKQKIKIHLINKKYLFLKEVNCRLPRHQQ